MVAKERLKYLIKAFIWVRKTCWPSRFYTFLLVLMLVVLTCSFPYLHFWSFIPCQEYTEHRAAAEFPSGRITDDNESNLQNGVSHANETSSSEGNRLKIFVYDVPREFTQDLLEEDIILTNHSIQELERLHQGGMEVIFHKFLVENRSGIRTRDPYVADLFFVPFYSIVSSRLGKLYSKYRLFEKLVRHLRSSYPFWDRCGGCDHFFILGRHYSENTAYGVTSHHLLLKTSSIFLLLEVTNHNQKALRNNVWSFSRSVFLPFPQLLPHGREPPKAEHTRSILISFTGSPITRTRRLLAKGLKESNLSVHVHVICRKQDPGVVQREIRNAYRTSEKADTSLADVYASSDFCLCPRGSSRVDARLFDAIRHECIPVIVNNDMRILPFSAEMEYDKYTIFSEVSSPHDVSSLLSYLSSFSHNDKKRMRSTMRIKRGRISYNPTQFPNAFDTAMQQLSHRANIIKPLRRHMEKQNNPNVGCQIHAFFC